MTDREKLIELLTDNLPHCDNPMQYTYDEVVERLADHLIANGVTIQEAGYWEWDTEDIYKCSNCGDKVHVKEVMGQPDWGFCPACGAKMLPEPPKGE